MAPAADERADADGFQPTEGAEKRLGTVVAGTYRITRHIGSGGSSHVFEAEHLRLGSVFAIKLLRSEIDANRRAAQRFRREARAIARLKSEHIVSVIDCGELDDGTPYLVMELLEGEDLRSLIQREQSLPARRAVPLLIEACRGLSEVHAAGLVHRDLKPENLFITRRSTGEDWCKVLDFGVAKMEASLSTAQGAIVGTLRYMAPEQLEASTEVNEATDVYALGAILYECLCGKPAHPGGTPQEVMYSVMHRAPSDAPLHESGIPGGLVSVIMSCLGKQQNLRPRGTAELLELLSRSLPSTENRTSFATLAEDDRLTADAQPHPNKPPRKHARLVWTATVAAMAAGTLLGWLLPRASSGTEAADPSRPDGTAHEPTASSRASLLAASSPQPLEASPPPSQAPSGAAEPIASAAGAANPTPTPRYRGAGRAVPAGTPPASRSARVPVGGFDPANPYGE